MGNSGKDFEAERDGLFGGEDITPDDSEEEEEDETEEEEEEEK